MQGIAGGLAFVLPAGCVILSVLLSEYAGFPSLLRVLLARVCAARLCQHRQTCASTGRRLALALFQSGANMGPMRIQRGFLFVFGTHSDDGVSRMCQIGLASLGQSEMGCVCRCRRDEFNELMCENAWRPFPVVAIGRACFACRFSEVASFGAFRKSASDAHFLPLDDVSCEKRNASFFRKTVRVRISPRS